MPLTVETIANDVERDLGRQGFAVPWISIATLIANIVMDCIDRPENARQLGNLSAIQRVGLRLRARRTAIDAGTPRFQIARTAAAIANSVEGVGKSYAASASDDEVLGLVGSVKQLAGE